MRKTFLFFILINNLLGEWHFHLRDLKSEDLGMSKLVNHPRFQEQRRQFFFFSCNFPFLLQTTRLWSWFHFTVNFCLENCLREWTAVLIEIGKRFALAAICWPLSYFNAMLGTLSDFVYCILICIMFEKCLKMTRRERTWNGSVEQICTYVNTALGTQVWG